jgi:hypothetical protein
MVINIKHKTAMYNYHHVIKFYYDFLQKNNPFRDSKCFQSITNIGMRYDDNLQHL